MTSQQVYAKAREHYGFIDINDVRVLANDPRERLTQLLVRWYEGRALIAAQSVEHFINALDKQGWCLRDIGFPSGSHALS